MPSGSYNDGLLVHLRPTAPWRIGPDSGDRDRVDRIYHSDSLYSAITNALASLGELEQWLEATATASAPAVRFSSCFPFHANTRYVVPPRHLWPPPASSKVRWKGARFVPLSVVESLLQGQPVSEEAWTIDVQSECLVAANPPAPGPYRVGIRTAAAMDREGAAVLPHSSACLEFTPGSGLWFAIGFANEEARNRWSAPVIGALRLLADSGFGGERSRGWGRSEMPQISTGVLSELLGLSPSASGGAYWLLSLFHPASADQVDWTQGNYALETRHGRVESVARHGEPKKPTRMVTEGSVLVASAALQGEAQDVAPEGFPHPVYRSGFALALPIALKGEAK